MKDVVLIVDPFSTGRLYSPEFKKQGFDCIAFINKNIPEKTKNTLIKEDFVDVFEDTEKCKNYNIKAVVAGSESGVEMAEKLAFELGVTGNDITIPDMRRNKFVMQETLKKNELRSIPTFHLTKDNVGEALNFAESKSGYILKPNKSACSEDVIFCKTKEDLKEAINKIDWQKANVYGNVNQSYLIQSFIEGDEYVVDLVCKNGEFKVASLCIYEKTKANGSSFVYKALNVLNPSDEKYKSIINYARQASKALGFKIGAIHMELKLDETPVMIEVGARMHGGIAPLLFKECYAPHLLEMSVNSYVSEVAPEEAKLIKNGKIIFLISEMEKVFHLDDTTIQNLKQIEGYKGHVMFVNNGEKQVKTIDLLTATGIVYFASEDKSVLEKAEEETRRLFNS